MKLNKVLEELKDYIDVSIDEIENDRYQPRNGVNHLDQYKWFVIPLKKEYYTIVDNEEVYSSLNLTLYKIDNIPEKVYLMPSLKSDADYGKFPNYDGKTGNLHLTKDLNIESYEDKKDAMVKQIVLVGQGHAGPKPKKESVIDKLKTKDIEIIGKNKTMPIFEDAYYPKIDSNDTLEKSIDDLKKYLDNIKKINNR